MSSFHHHHHLAFLNPLLCLSLLSTKSPGQKEVPFMVEYLISSFGFSPNRALRYSTDNKLTSIKSSDRPELVVRFLKETGLSDIQIKAVVSFCPPLPASDVEKTLKSKGRTFTRCNVDSLRRTTELIEELGIPRGDGIFLSVLKAVGSYSRDILERNVEFFKIRYWWSQEEVCVSFKKCPSVLRFTEEKVKSNMHFLISQAGFEAREIAFQSRLLVSSVERVLIPRYNVLCALKAKGVKKNISLLVAWKMGERSFRESCVLPFEKLVPGLGEAYAAAYGVKVQV